MTSDLRRYEILAPLGRGGFGTVYRARVIGAQGFSKLVAIKVLNPEMADTEEVAVRLRDEARMLGLLRHRALVHSDGLVRLAGRWSVVMEYVEGVNLKRMCEATRVPIGVALEIVGEVAGALHVAYTSPGPDGRPLHVLHRDIKLANIQVTPVGEVKVLDFGIARAEFDSRESETREVHFGSELYMSPERHDLVYTAAGDVYALGIVLYHLLAGCHFGRTSANPASHEARLDAGLRTLRDKLPTGEGNVDGVLDLVEEMLAFDASRRPTARDAERRCLELRRQLGGPSLRDWAESAIPPIAGEALPDGEDGLVGRVLAEGSETVTRTPPDVTLATRVPTRSRWIGIVVGAGVVLAGAAAVVAVVASPEEPDPALPEAPAPVVVASPPLSPPAPTQAEVAVATVPPAAAPAEAPAKPAPKEARAPSKRAAAAPPAGTGRVRVVGDDVPVWLSGDGGRHVASAPVPAGTFRVEAEFEEGQRVESGKVTVVAGGTVTLRCNRAFRRCQPE
ncbi:MAG: serine/threonine-protein kinase [Myxococcota bacterium]